MKNKYFFFSLVFLVSLLVGLKLFNPLIVFAQTCPGPPPDYNDTCTRTEVGCNAASAYCGNDGFCHYTWECNCYGEWGPCVGGYQTRECSATRYQIQKCGGGSGGSCNNPEAWGINCPPGTVRGNTIVSSTCLPATFCPGPGTAQQDSGICCQMSKGVKATCNFEPCPTRNNPNKICKVCTGGEDPVCTRNYLYTYNCVPTCDANAWGAWSACSAVCGGGSQSRTNACGTQQWQTCNTQSCQGPWWQVMDSDVTATGDIVSKMPAGYYFDTIGSGGFPGVPIYRDQIAVTPGTISSTLWSANTTTSLPRIFDYSYFENLIPDDTVINDISKLTTGVGVTLDANGYEWYKITGNIDTQ